MENVVLTIHLLLALVLIGVVLLQNSEGGGLGVGGSGGAGGSGRPPLSASAKLTWGLITAFIATSIWLTIMAAQNSANVSVLDRIVDAPARVESEAVSGEDLLPPSLDQLEEQVPVLE